MVHAGLCEVYHTILVLYALDHSFAVHTYQGAGAKQPGLSGIFHIDPFGEENESEYGEAAKSLESK